MSGGVGGIRMFGVDPNEPTVAAVRALRANGISYGYANYWVAYKVDFISGNQLTFTPGPWDLVRSLAMYSSVRSRPRPAWLFVPGGQLNTALHQFGTTNVEVGYDPEANFTAALNAQHVPFTVVHAGLLDAVTPAERIDPRQVGVQVPSGS